MLAALFLAACAPPCALTPGSPAPHTLAVSWEGASRQDSVVRYRLEDDDTEHTVEATRDGGVWSATLDWLPALTAVRYVGWEGDVRACDGVVTTENLPAGLPTWRVSGEPSWEHLLGVAMGQHYALFVIDGLGRVRWHHLQDNLLDVATSSDGSRLHHNTVDPQRLDDIGAVVTLDWAGDTLEQVPAEGMHHSFTMLPEGGFAYLAIDVRDWTDPQTGLTEPVVGDALWEVSADGSRRQVFTLWDHAEPVPHEHWDDRFYAQGRDWSHGNDLSYDDGSGRYLLSMANLDAVVEVSRETGDIERWISPDRWTISGEVFDYPHTPSWVGPDRLLVFSFAEGAIGAIEYAVDDDAQRLEAVWSHTRSDDLMSFLGSAQRLGGGSTLINYGASGLIEEVSPDGEVLWRLESAFGSWVGAAAPLSARASK